MTALVATLAAGAIISFCFYQKYVKQGYGLRFGPHAKPPEDPAVQLAQRRQTNAFWSTLAFLLATTVTLYFSGLFQQ